MWTGGAGDQTNNTVISEHPAQAEFCAVLSPRNYVAYIYNYCSRKHVFKHNDRWNGNIMLTNYVFSLKIP